MRNQGAGNAACSREYGRSHSVAHTADSVWGAFLSGLLVRSSWPASIAAISCRIAIIASQNRSSSALDSLSVGSTMSVPGTGNDIVGAWKPKSMRRLAMSSASMPAVFLKPVSYTHLRAHETPEHLVCRLL